MALETITREEFDRRLDAANARKEQGLRHIEEQQAQSEQLLDRYESAFSEIEAELDRAETESPTYSGKLHGRRSAFRPNKS